VPTGGGSEGWWGALSAKAMHEGLGEWNKSLGRGSGTSPDIGEGGKRVSKKNERRGGQGCNKKGEKHLSPIGEVSTK